MSETAMCNTTTGSLISLPVMAVPGHPPLYLSRPRLIAELDTAAQGPVALVSAPAGWGKTAVVAAWARTGRTERLLWLTARSHDDSALWRRLLAALAATGLI